MRGSELTLQSEAQQNFYGTSHGIDSLRGHSLHVLRHVVGYEVPPVALQPLSGTLRSSTEDEGTSTRLLAVLTHPPADLN